MIDTQLASWSGENAPNWISRTFSDGVRLVWFFEQPLPMDNPELVKPFLKIAAAELGVKTIFPSWDEGALYDPSHIYEVGRGWRLVAASPISTYRLHDMCVRASEKVRWDREGTRIPLEVIADEVEQRWPGAWPGDFEVGARGPVFWDGGSNPTSVIVQENGCVCFSRDKVFYTWRDIFGPKFVEKFEQDRIGAAASEAYYDGQKYWLKSERGIWQPHGKDD